LLRSIQPTTLHENIVGCQENKQIDTVGKMKLEIGQVWKYKTRSSEDASRLTIVNLEENTVHIYLEGINVTTANGNCLENFYMPLSTESFLQSVTVLDDAHRAGFNSLYQNWLNEHDTRGQGIFTVELDTFLSSLDQSATK
jgi:fumarate hydratase class II